jgi:hypothetical protein
MVVSGPEKSMEIYAMASNFRHVADGTRLPGYRARLLEVARDLEGEAAKLSDQDFFAPRSRETSRAG